MWENLQCRAHDSTFLAGQGGLPWQKCWVMSSTLLLVYMTSWHNPFYHKYSASAAAIEKLNIWRWSQSYRYYRNKINSIQKKISNQQFLSISIFESIRRAHGSMGVFITHTWLDSSYVKNQNLQWFSPAPSSTLITFFLRRMALNSMCTGNSRNFHNGIPGSKSGSKRSPFSPMSQFVPVSYQRLKSLC